MKHLAIAAGHYLFFIAASAWLITTHGDGRISTGATFGGVIGDGIGILLALSIFGIFFALARPMLWYALAIAAAGFFCWSNAAGFALAIN
jgi:hypothetical protein